MKYTFFIRLSILLYLSLPALLYGQSLILSNLLETSDVVIEGQVMSKTFVKDEKTGTIYTLNHVKVLLKIKGEVDSSLVVRTEGGRINGITQVVSHSIQFAQNEEGIFMLKSAPDLLGVYEFSTNAQKILKIVGDRNKEGYDFNNKQPVNNWRQFRDQIIKLCNPVNITDQKEILPRFQVENVSEICFLLTNPVILFETQSIQFDIYVKSNVDGLKFSDANLNIKYPSDVFGVNTVQNNNVEVQKQAIISDAAYQVSMQDVSEDKFSVAIGTSCRNYNSSYTLSVNYEKMARVIIKIENWGNLLELQDTPLEAEGFAKYFESKENCVDFRGTCFEYKLNFNSCVVNSVEVAPFGAGILQTITIKGNGFGGTLGQNSFAKIDIPNAENGGITNIVLSGADQDYIVNWQDDEITLRISSMVFGGNSQTMGSGTWEIYPNFIVGNDFCPVVVDIDYALSNETENGVEKMIGLALNIYDPAIPDDGALEWYIDEGISSDPVLIAKGITFNMVEQVAKQVFCDWETTVEMDFRYMGPISGANDVVDDKNVLFFGNPGTNRLALTKTIYKESVCANDPYFRGRFLEFDINIDKQRDWYISTEPNIGNNQYDLYSVLLHEVGHGLLLKHSMDINENNGTNDDRIMYWALDEEQIKRTIDARTESGVELLIDRTIQSIDDPFGCFNGYDINIYPDGCTPSSTIEFTTATPCGVKIGTLNKINDAINFYGDNLEGTQVHLFNIDGQLVYHTQLNKYNRGIPTNGLTPGMYFLQYSCNGGIAVNKIILHN